MTRSHDTSPRTKDDNKSLVTFRFESARDASDFLLAAEVLAGRGHMLIHDHVTVGPPSSNSERSRWIRHEWSPGAAFALPGAIMATVALFVTAAMRTSGTTMLLAPAIAGVVSGAMGWAVARFGGAAINAQRIEALRNEPTGSTCTLLASHIDEEAIIAALKQYPEAALVEHHSDLDAVAFVEARVATARESARTEDAAESRCPLHRFCG